MMKKASLDISMVSIGVAMFGGLVSVETQMGRIDLTRSSDVTASGRLAMVTCMMA